MSGGRDQWVEAANEARKRRSGDRATTGHVLGVILGAMALVTLAWLAVIALASAVVVPVALIVDIIVP